KEGGLLTREKAEKLQSLLAKVSKSYPQVIAILAASLMKDEQLVAVATKSKDGTVDKAALEKETLRRALEVFRKEPQLSEAQKKAAFRMQASLKGLTPPAQKAKLEELAKQAVTNKEANTAYRVAFHPERSAQENSLGRMAHDAFEKNFSSEVKTATNYKSLYNEQGQKYETFQDGVTKKQFLVGCEGEAKCYSHIMAKYEEEVKTNAASASKNFFAAAKELGLSHVTDTGDQYRFQTVDTNTNQLFFVHSDNTGTLKYDTVPSLENSAEIQKHMAGIGDFTHSLKYYTWSASHPEQSKEEEVFFTNGRQFDLLDNNGKKMNIEKKAANIVLAYDTRTKSYRLAPVEPVTEDTHTSGDGVIFTHGENLVIHTSTFAQWAGSTNDGKAIWTDGRNKWVLSPAKNAPPGASSYTIQWLAPPPPIAYQNYWDCRT
ncbi:MAG: hypothetical protein HY537_03770, partial [Deltaproteobacteria bacterium]|nr:hypothetical protein [Deltaproteobacteria bacterium]